MSVRSGHGRFRAPALLSIALFVSCAGCALDSSRKLSFEVSPGVSDQIPVLANSVGVLPLSDDRPNEFTDTHGYLILVPLVFYVSGSYEKPERDWWPGKKEIEKESASQQSTTPIEALSQGLAKAIGSRKLFKSVTYSNSGTDAELILKGSLRSTRLEEIATLYGLSFAALPVGVLGAPARYWTWHLALDLQLQEPLTQTVLWQKSYQARHEVRFSGLYYREAPSPLYWDSYLLVDLVPGIVRDLEQEVAKIKGGKGSSETGH